MGTHMYIGNGLGAEGDEEDDDDRNDKQDDGKVQVVHSTDYRGALARLHAAPSSISKLGDHTGHPDQKSYDQSPEGSLGKKTVSDQLLNTLWSDRGRRRTVREKTALGPLKPEHRSGEHGSAPTQTLSRTPIPAEERWETESLPPRAGTSGWGFLHQRGPLRLPTNATYVLIDSLAENSKQEDRCDGGSQVTGDGLDVVEELPALCGLYDGHPRDADANQHQDEHSESKAPTMVSTIGFT